MTDAAPYSRPEQAIERERRARMAVEAANHRLLVLQAALDEALYGAKHTGRNRVVAADDASAPIALAS